MIITVHSTYHHCEQCHIVKGDYTEPKTQQGSLIAQQPLELLCIDFTKADMAKGRKENILVLTDAFSKFVQAFITNNQKSSQLRRFWWRDGSLYLEYLPGSIVIRVGLLTMKSSLIFVNCMVFISLQQCHTIPTETLNVSSSIEHCLDLCIL